MKLNHLDETAFQITNRKPKNYLPTTPSAVVKFQASIITSSGCIGSSSVSQCYDYRQKFLICFNSSE
jgi:hypothetical protein